jgi:hypothetical protein
LLSLMIENALSRHGLVPAALRHCLVNSFTVHLPDMLFTRCLRFFLHYA